MGQRAGGHNTVCIVERDLFDDVRLADPAPVASQPDPVRLRLATRVEVLQQVVAIQMKRNQLPVMRTQSIGHHARPQRLAASQPLERVHLFGRQTFARVPVR